MSILLTLNEKEADMVLAGLSKLSLQLAEASMNLGGMFAQEHYEVNQLMNDISQLMESQL